MAFLSALMTQTGCERTRPAAVADPYEKLNRTLANLQAVIETDPRDTDKIVNAIVSTKTEANLVQLPADTNIDRCLDSLTKSSQTLRNIDTILAYKTMTSEHRKEFKSQKAEVLDYINVNASELRGRLIMARPEPKKKKV